MTATVDHETAVRFLRELAAFHTSEAERRESESVAALRLGLDEDHVELRRLATIHATTAAAVERGLSALRSQSGS